MGLIEKLTLKIKRGESAPYRLLRGIAKWGLHANVPLPRAIKPVLRGVYNIRFLLVVVLRRAYVLFIAEPLFRSRCEQAGKNLSISALPLVYGHTEIYLGDNVTLTGELSVFSGRFFEKPRLVLKDNAALGANAVVVVNKEVVLEEHVIVAPNCRISDSDGHPKEAHLRAQGMPVNPNRDIQPVRICRYAWVGTGCYVGKGVTIGEGAIIGANSVVISDIPPYCIAMGNPAEVFFRNVGKARQAKQMLPSRHGETGLSGPVG